MTTVVEKQSAPATPAPVEPRRPQSPQAYSSLLWVTTVIGVLAAWIVAYAVGLSALQEHHTQHVLYAKLRQQLALQIAPPHVLASGRVAPLGAGQPLALLTVPRLGLRNAVVVQGSSGGDLRSGPGHVPGTALPGEDGTSWILGKATTYGAPFGNLASLRSGDQVVVTTQEGRFVYVVNDVRGAGDRIPATSTTARLTLGSIAGSGWRTGWAPTSGVYVDASLQSKPLPVSATPQAITTADAMMHGDSSALVPMFLWMLALVGSVVLLTWARVRWGGWQAWLAGVPVIVAALWGTTDALLQLLPNVL